ncbi:MAG: ComF family protein, partial [Nitrospinae bacterium]|nr:ComF family protein [Nitrospinota bacterium]
LSMWRLFFRGYNQSYLLAQHFAVKAGLEIADGALIRVKHTRPQYGLSREERGENVKGVFATRRRGIVEGAKILLFDDIFTTGATARECARTLIKSGAQSVRVAALFWAGPA